MGLAPPHTLGEARPIGLMTCRELQCLAQGSEQVMLNARGEVISGLLDEGTSCDQLVKLDVAIRDLSAVLWGHRRDDFACTPLEAMLDEPLTDKLLGELLLLLLQDQHLRTMSYMHIY